MANFLLSNFLYADKLFKSDDNLRDFYDNRYQTSEPQTNDPRIKSKLNKRITLNLSGSIAYREPQEGTNGPVIILFHAIYGGVSHRAWNKFLPMLDRQGYRVYIMDLPGTGASDKPRKKYTINDIDSFIEEFSQLVKSKENGSPVHAVGTSTITSSLLHVTGEHPDLFKSVTVFSPVGVNTLSKEPGFFQSNFSNYKKRMRTGEVDSYINLLRPDEVKYYIGQSLVNPESLDENHDLVVQSRYQQANWDQRWITYAFIAGMIYRPFKKAVEKIDQTPVLSVFGKKAKPFKPKGLIGQVLKIKAEKMSDFKSIVKDKTNFSFHQIENGASALWQENTEEIFQVLQNFINENQ